MTTEYFFHGTGDDLSINNRTIDNNKDAIIYLSGSFKQISIFSLQNVHSTTRIKPKKNTSATMNRLSVNQCTRLTVHGDDRIAVTGTVAETGLAATRPMVGINGEQCVVEGLRVYSSAHTEHWQPGDWLAQARNGIELSGESCCANFNDVFNVRTGIQVRSPNGQANGNTVSHFYEDGMRALADNVTLARNHIMFAQNTNKDAIHSDAIQMWNLAARSPQEGILEGVSILHNYIWNRSDNPGSRLMQGIGCFDGVMRDAKIIGNLVMTDHFHGITLGIAQNSVIQDNFVFSTQPALRQSWIKIGTKKPTNFISTGNVVAMNESAAYVFKPEMVKQDFANQTIGVQPVQRDPSQERAVA